MRPAGVTVVVHVVVRNTICQHYNVRMDTTDSDVIHNGVNCICYNERRLFDSRREGNLMFGTARGGKIDVSEAGLVEQGDWGTGVLASSCNY